MPFINITLPDQMKSFMDERHYDPNEIDSLYLPPNTNGETTWYVDGTNGSDSNSGLSPTDAFKTISKACGQYDGHRWGERVLIRTGIYKIDNLEVIMNLAGTADEDHYFTFAPYGDGEVVFDCSYNSDISGFSVLNSNVYVATYPNAARNYSPGAMLLDYDMRNARPAIEIYNSDNSGVNNKTTSMVDTTKNFLTYSTEFTSGTLNPVGAYIYNIADRSWGVVTSVSTTTNPNDTLNFSGGLSGGTNNKFNNQDPYLLTFLTNDGDWQYIDHRKKVIDNSGINNKSTYCVDTTKNFAGYDGGLIKHNDAYGPITSISTTVNTNDTINFSKGLISGGESSHTVIDNNDGAVPYDQINVYKRLTGSEINGTATHDHWQDLGKWLIDSTKNFAGLEGAIVLNVSDGSFFKVDFISTTINPNDTIICSSNLTGGGSNIWHVGDTYQIYRVENSYNKLLIKSTTGTPESRNYRFCQFNGSGGAAVRVGNNYVRFYGITLICAHSIGMFFLSNHIKIEKCRFMWCGKHAVSGGYADFDYYTISKCFVYQCVMFNWPRGNTYGANGGWPQSIQINSPFGSVTQHSTYDGMIIYDNGGEGVGPANFLENSIIMNNYSMNVYFEHSDMTIRRNVVILVPMSETDFLHDFFLGWGYNSWTRNFNKMHPQGIMMAAENSGPHIQVSGIKIYNNIILGCWKGIGQYYEWGPNGLINSILANNLIITPEYPGNLFEPITAIFLSLSSADSNSIVKNNIIIGKGYVVEGGPFGGQKNFLNHITDNYPSYSQISYNKNLYSFPAVTTPFSINYSGKTFAQWKTATGWDANSVLTDTPGLANTLYSVDFSTISAIHKKHLKLLVSSIGIDMGDNLSSYFTDDFNGDTRPSTGPWDVGPMKYLVTTQDYTKEALTSIPATVTDLSTEFLPVEYDYVASIDSRYTTITATNKYGVFLFKDISNTPTGHPPINIKWVGKSNISCVVSTTYLQIYNITSATWETLASNNTTVANTQFTLTAAINNNLVNYYDTNKIATCRVYQQAIAG